jgi:hypothetical protein
MSPPLPPSARSVLPAMLPMLLVELLVVLYAPLARMVLVMELLRVPSARQARLPVYLGLPIAQCAWDALQVHSLLLELLVVLYAFLVRALLAIYLVVYVLMHLILYLPFLVYKGKYSANNGSVECSVCDAGKLNI